MEIMLRKAGDGEIHSNRPEMIQTHHLVIFQEFLCFCTKAVQIFSCILQTATSPKKFNKKHLRNKKPGEHVFKPHEPRLHAPAASPAVHFVQDLLCILKLPDDLALLRQVRLTVEHCHALLFWVFPCKGPSNQEKHKLREASMYHLGFRGCS